MVRHPPITTPANNIIARNRGHFAPVINCQRNLIFKMADKNDRSQGKRISYDILNNLSSVDLFYDEKSKKKTSSKKILGVYQAERLIATKQDFVGLFLIFPLIYFHLNQAWHANRGFFRAWNLVYIP